MTKIHWFDTHCHLADEQLASQADDVIARASSAGVAELLSVATDVRSTLACIALANRYSGVFASAGIHPNHVLEAAPGDWDEIVKLASHPRVVALGETGLDCYWKDVPLAQQIDYFDRHLELSRRTGLPVIIHMRESGQPILEQLQRNSALGPIRGVMHSFTGDAQMAETVLSLGLHISFAGMLTYKKSDELRDVAKTIPLDRLLVETDSPYLSPHPHRSVRPNEPAMVIHTAACLAEARGMSPADLSSVTLANSRRLFALREST